MFNRKNIRLSLITILISGLIMSCSNKEQLLPERDKIKEIYELAKESGFKGTYEEWIASITGEKGDPGHSPIVTIGPNGNWFIDGNDSDILAKGETGPQGEQGVSIISIVKTDSKDNIDVYTITYSNGSTSTFEVTNGVNGENGLDGINGENGIKGEPGKDGHSPIITIGSNGNWHVDNVDTGICALGNHTNENFVVTFNLCGGTIDEPFQEKVEVKWGQTIDLSLPTKKGYRFVGWYTSLNVNAKKFSIGDAVFSDLNLYAKYEKGIFSVNYVLNGGKIDFAEEVKTEFEYYENYKIPVNVTRFGYKFKGWSLNGEIIPYTGIYAYENITLEAVWEENLNHTITLLLNGGSCNGETTINVRTNEEYEIIVEPYYENFVFMGWYDENNRLFPTYGNYSYDHDIQLTARRESRKTYEFMLDLNGGTTEATTSFTLNNEEIRKGVYLPVPIKEGLKFAGYYYLNQKASDQNGLLFVDLNFNTYQQNVLFAKYSSNDPSVASDILEYGSYPQTKIEDYDLILSLEKISEKNSKGYIEFNGKEYAKEDEIFGISYFLVEPLHWIKLINGDYMSDNTIDIVSFYNSDTTRSVNDETIHPNNYKYSSVRAFLNGYDGTSYNVPDYSNNGLISKIFTKEEQAHLQTTLVEQSDASTGQTNPYFSGDTEDKLYIPSREDVLNEIHNSSITINRVRKPTDYAKLKFKKSPEEKYWLRTPYKYDNKICRVLNSIGKMENTDIVTKELGLVVCASFI